MLIALDSQAIGPTCVQFYRLEIPKFRIVYSGKNEASVRDHFNRLREDIDSHLFSEFLSSGTLEAFITSIEEPSLVFSKAKSKLNFPLLLSWPSSESGVQMEHSDAIFIHEYTHFLTLSMWAKRVDRFDDFLNYRDSARQIVEAHHKEKVDTNEAFQQGKISYGEWNQFNINYLEVLQGANEKRIYNKMAWSVVLPYGEFLSDLASVLHKEDPKAIRLAVEFLQRQTATSWDYIKILRPSHENRIRDFESTFTESDYSEMERRNTALLGQESGGYGGISLAKARFFKLGYEAATQTMQDELSYLGVTQKNFTVHERSSRLWHYMIIQLSQLGVM